MITVRVPATTANLGPGFDCMGIALKLYNQVRIEEIDKGLEINIIDDSRRFLPRFFAMCNHPAPSRVYKHDVLRHTTRPHRARFTKLTRKNSAQNAFMCYNAYICDLTGPRRGAAYIRWRI